MSFAPDHGFTTTRWSLVLAAGRHPSPASRTALSELCGLYWQPLYGYARRQGYSVEQAQDLTQAFFTRLLEKQFVRAADPNRGRFRSFLLASFKHFAANEHDRERALKRGGDRLIVPLEFEEAEKRLSFEPRDPLTPEVLFEQDWARGVLSRAVAALGAECAASGKAKLFEHVKDSLTGEKPPGGHAALARTLDVTEGALKVTIHRLRRRLRAILRAEIAATVSEESEIDDEIRHLIAVLSDP